MGNFESIIKRIRERREFLGLSYQDVADRTGLSKSTLQRYETGAIKNIPLDRLEDLAKALKVSAPYLMGWEEVDLSANTIKIPILGSVPAGQAVEAVTDIVGEVEIDRDLSLSGSYFALKIKGDSMSPDIKDGDVVIVREQCKVESGEIAIVYINGHEATCKKVIITNNGVILQAINPNYPPQSFGTDEKESLPVVILGKVTGLRRDF